VIKKSKEPYILFLDSDIELEKNWLKYQITKIEENKKNGMICGKLLFPKEKTGKKNIINAAGSTITRTGFGIDIGRGEKDSKKFNKEKKIAYACSAAVLIKRNLLKKIGYFDEDFFYPHEDTDLCWRALIANYNIIYNPKAIAYHYTSYTTQNLSEKVAFNVTKNRIKSILKNYSLTNIIIYLPLHLILILGNIILKSHKKSKIKGFIWVILNINKTLKDRKKVQRTRVLKDRKVLKLFSNRIF
jgi:hypothetical protein